MSKPLKPEALAYVRQSMKAKHKWLCAWRLMNRITTIENKQE